MVPECQEGIRWVQWPLGLPVHGLSHASIPRDVLRHALRSRTLSQAPHSPGVRPQELPLCWLLASDLE